MTTAATFDRSQSQGLVLVPPSCRVPELGNVPQKAYTVQYPADLIDASPESKSQVFPSMMRQLYSRWQLPEALAKEDVPNDTDEVARSFKCLLIAKLPEPQE